MRILVSGGAGLIGSHIADLLVARGERVLIVDDFSTGQRRNLPEGAELAEVSIATPRLDAVVAEFAPEAVIHQAAQVNLRASVADPGGDANTNVVGTVRLANAAVTAGARVFLFASSGGAIYGEQDVFPAPESHPRRPVSPYGAAKLCGETYLDYFARATGLRVVHLRYANVYGPRQDPHGEAGVVAIFSKRVLDGEPPLINGDGLQTRDYVYVGDVARANLLALDDDAATGAFNIGTSKETDVVTIAAKISKAAGYTGTPRHGPPAAGEQRRSVLDAGRAAQVLGWRPEMELDRGIAATVDWFGNAGH